jgi:hypothetical protein
MIFRDKKTGALLNIRRDEFINDRMYFQEMIHIHDKNRELKTRVTIPYTRPFQELQSQNNYT